VQQSVEKPQMEATSSSILASVSNQDKYCSIDQSETLDEIVLAKTNEPLQPIKDLPVMTNVSQSTAALSTPATSRSFKTESNSSVTKQPSSSSGFNVVARVLSNTTELEFNHKPSLSPSNFNNQPTAYNMVMTEVADSVHEKNHRSIQHVNPTVISNINSGKSVTDMSNSALHMMIPGTERSLQYVLQGLGTTATLQHRKEVHILLKKLAKKGDESYWENYGHQVRDFQKMIILFITDFMFTF
jgi:hypothetical protein